ncbi:MAG: NADH-quinone oxidoreductase subunit J family protein [Thermoguttaceae bacterium]
MLDSNYILVVATVFASLGIWLLLPRASERGRFLGAMFTAISFGLGASQLPFIGDWFVQSEFAVLALVTLVAAIAAMTFRNPIYCAIWFGLALLGVAGLLLLAGAQFLAVATIVVYAGAILVTFLFVLMLAQPEGKSYYDRISWEALISASTGMVLVCLLSVSVGAALNREAGQAVALTAPSAAELARGVLAEAHVAAIGGELFRRYLIAVDISGVLLFAAIVGAAAIAAQGKSNPRKDGNQ